MLAAVQIAATAACLIFSSRATWDHCPAESEKPCGDQNQLCGHPFQGGPQYHFRDLSCGLNDPNAPFYDAVHQLYHLFYQDHIGRAIPGSYPQGFEGASWGHGVSPDMVHWTHSPVAMWNGEDWYDIHALFTGSATVVDGKPILMFPGVCDMYPPSGTIPGCDYGYTFGVANPANYSDPFYTRWTKSMLNPIVNDTFDDPSTAWQTSHGELCWIANCGDGTVGNCGPNGSQAPLYCASDASFASARKIGFTNLGSGECPSLFELPPLSPGTSAVAAMPTHVHKWGCQPYKDCTELGTWHDGAAGQVGWWERHPDIPNIVLIDQGMSYASKDMFDSKKNRRISFAWARLQPAAQGSQVNGDVQTLAREVTYHPVLQQLLFAPLEEQASLRQELLGTVQKQSVSTEHNLVLGPWPHANQSDILISVEIPKNQMTLYVSIQAEVRIKFYVDFTKLPAASPSNASAKFYDVEVGMLTDDPYTSIKDTLRLLNDDKVLELRLLLDHTITEAYWQGGRVAMTVPSPLTNSTSITLSTDTPDASLQVRKASIWSMASAWISKEDALHQRDGDITWI